MIATTTIGLLQMPSNVRSFAILSLVVLCAGIIESVAQFPSLSAAFAQFGGPKLVFAIYAGNFTIFAFLIWLIAYARQNWARLLFLGLWVLNLTGYLLSIYIAPTIFQRDPAGASGGVLQIVLQSVALYLIFTGNARPWFRREKTLAPSAPLRGAPPP